MIYINDYPMNVRRKVTTKVYMDEIVERTGVAFLARGSHLTAGPLPRPQPRRRQSLRASSQRTLLISCRPR